jgi:hypothetical protein
MLTLEHNQGERMIQDENAQTSNPNNDIIEEVSAEELHTITGGCVRCGVIHTMANTLRPIAEGAGHPVLATQFKAIAEMAKASKDGTQPCAYNALNKWLNDATNELHRRVPVQQPAQH